MALFQRSTKGASKQRRELINVEINNVRDLLPLTDGVRKRLSQLQVMAVCKAYVSKCNFFDRSSGLSLECLTQSEETDKLFEFPQALPGFLLMATMDGKLMYLSDNVMEVLGHSMVDIVTQSECIYEMFDSTGQMKIQQMLSRFENSEINDSTSSCSSAAAAASSLENGQILLDEMSFTCLMGLTRSIRRHPGLDKQKIMKIRACILKPTTYSIVDSCDPVFLAFCSPWHSSSLPLEHSLPIFDTMVYRSKHSLDMKFVNIDVNAECHLGYSEKEMRLKSWFEMIHPDDETEASTKLMDLISRGSDSISTICIRVQTKFGHFIWLQVTMQTVTASCSSDNFSSTMRQPEIFCLNHVISEEEATFIREHEKHEAQLAELFLSAQTPFDVAGGNFSQFPTALVDDGFLGNEVGYFGQSTVMTSLSRENNNVNRLKRRANNDAKSTGKPRKTRRSTEEEFASSDSGSFLSYGSPNSQERSPSYQTASGYQEMFRSDFDLHPRESTAFQPKVSPAHSIFFDSTIGNSPRMFPEDEGTFFLSVPTPEQLKNGQVSDKKMNNSSNSNPLVDSFLDDWNVQSALQEVPNELPELHHTDVEYLDLGNFEDIPLHQDPPSYATLSQVNFIPARPAPPKYKWNPTISPSHHQQQQQQQAAINMSYSHIQQPNNDNHNNNNGTNSRMGFSGFNFLERLVESPEFVELIERLAKQPQTINSFVEREFPCHA